MRSKSRRPIIGFPSPVLSITPSNSITLAPIGQPHRNSSSSVIDIGTSQTLNYAKGYVGARWSAFDDDGDSLVYKVEIRGVKETGWKLLKDAREGEISELGQHRVSGRRIRGSRDGFRFAQQSARPGAGSLARKRSVPDRQYAAADSETGRARLSGNKIEVTGRRRMPAATSIKPSTR